MSEDGTARRVREVLAKVKPLAAEYFRLTGKPLGVTGEVAEHVAAETLGLELAAARTAGYDAVRRRADGSLERTQIKGRACGADANPGRRLGTIKRGADCDTVLLVLLDRTTLEAREMWEAPYAAVVAQLAQPGSRARERGQLGVTTFKRLARRVWSLAGPDTSPAPAAPDRTGADPRLAATPTAG